MSDETLIQLSACEMVDLLGKQEVSPADALDALQAQITRVDGEVNALPTLCFDRAHDHVKQLMKKNVEQRGLLKGLPVSIKDLNAVAGVRTTMGSKVYENNIPEISESIVLRLEDNGGVVYSKSNTPEFGAGGNTFNDVFPATRNPYDLTRTAGGSSGGAAAALASGTAWLAHGSDLAGSLRTPASFCGVASLRPSPGLIANSPSALPFAVLPQHGPMARNVEDVALFTDAMVGTDSNAGITKPQTSTTPFITAARHAVRPEKIAFSADLGIADTHPEVAAVCNGVIEDIAKLNVAVSHDHPDLSEATHSFCVQRALFFAQLEGERLDEIRHLVKPEVEWNIEQGLALDGPAIRQAMAEQTRVFNHAARFMQQYDVLICPAAPVTAFPVEERYLGYSDGVPISEYFTWLALGYLTTATTLPIITLPCGMSSEQLPIGIQLIGKPHGEYELFQYARYIEDMVNGSVYCPNSCAIVSI